MDYREVVPIIERYLYALQQKDLSGVPFAPDVIVEPPEGGEITGVTNVLVHLSHVLPVVQSVRILRHVVEGNNCATMYELETPRGRVRGFAYYCVWDGMITEMRVYHKPAGA